MKSRALLLNASSDHVALAAKLLKNNGIVAFGTETVYGLGANAYCARAIEKIFSAKNRPAYNPLIHHFADTKNLLAQAADDFPLLPLTRILLDRFAPGPLSVVLPRNKSGRTQDLACAGLNSFAARIPNKAPVLELIKACGFPLVAPSANPSGKISPTTARHVYDHLTFEIDAVLDTGNCRCGVESTIVDLSGDFPVLLRAGSITANMLECASTEAGFAYRFDTPASTTAAGDAIKAPGNLSSHYAPKLPVKLERMRPEPNEAFLAFGAYRNDTGMPFFNLSETGNLEEAARNLYHALHLLDAQGDAASAQAIAVMPIPDHGVGVAINDRLRRAAAPRPHSP